MTPEKHWRVFHTYPRVVSIVAFVLFVIAALKHYLDNEIAYKVIFIYLANVFMISIAGAVVKSKCERCGSKMRFFGNRTCIYSCPSCGHVYDTGVPPSSGGGGA